MIEHVTLTLPNLPADLHGLRIAHLTDLHARRPRRRFLEIAGQLANMHVDFAFFTGDYMSKPGDEPHAMEALKTICDDLHPTRGSFGVFGNHDTPELTEQARALPIHWLFNQAVTAGPLPLEILGLHTIGNTPPDAVALAQTIAALPPMPADKPKRTRLLLSHFQTWLPTAADLNVNVMFSGHTHGGQIRLPGKRALVNSSIWPLRLTSGILRLGGTLGVISRGLGEVGIPLRVFCPPQLPVYTLRRGPLPGMASDEITMITRW